MKAKIGIFLYIVFSFHLHGQDIEGKVINAETKEAIPFAKVGFPSINIFTSTNERGEFFFDHLPESHLKIKVTSFDFKVLLKEVDLSKSEKIILALTPLHTVFEEVKVTASEGRVQ